MIEVMEGLPENVLGFSARGRVSASDYEEVIMPAVERMIDRVGKVRFLYHLGPEFSGWEMAAMWDDARLGLSHPTAWEKVALVSDVEWIRAAVKMLGVVMPGHVRVFAESEMDAARSWVGE